MYRGSGESGMWWRDGEGDEGGGGGGMDRLVSSSSSTRPEGFSRSEEAVFRSSVCIEADEEK